MRERKLSVREAGAKGGRVRAANQTETERSELARNAARARWAKVREEREQVISAPNERG